MIASWISMILVVALSALVGRAATKLAGADRWTGLEPAVGFATILAAEGLFARLPIEPWGVILPLLILLAVSIRIIGRPGRGDLPTVSPGLVITLAVTAAAVSIPFAVTGHWGLLGVGYNNDLGLHLAWADWIRSGIGTEPAAGYPLGPHGLAATLSFIPFLELDRVFIGELMAMILLTAWTAWAAVGRLAGWKRPLAAVLVALPYLIASYYAQAAFKEMVMALFLLALVIALERIATDENWRPGEIRGLLPILLLIAGVILTYSFPGLLWPGVILIVAVIAIPALRERLRPSVLWNAVRGRGLVFGLLGLAALLLLLVLTGAVSFGGYFAQVSTGNAFGPVLPFEGLGVWLNSDYRLDGVTATILAKPSVVISTIALLVALWWWRREWPSVWPAAFLACAAIYLVTFPWAGDYSLAKALTVSSPITMTVILTALLSGPAGGWKPAQGMEFGAWVSLSAIFVLGAIGSSLLALRDASVAPPGHGAELASFRDRVADQTVLYMDQDRFAQWNLRGAAKVGVPLREFPDPDVIENPKKPFQGARQSTIDFDSFEPETFDNFEYAVGTAAAWKSEPPPSYRAVDRSGDFILWQRVGPPSGRSILDEAAMPAKLVDCEAPAGTADRELKGRATLMPETAMIEPHRWRPNGSLAADQRARAAVRLGPGTWRVSFQYFSPSGLTLTAPGYRRKFIPAIDGQRLSNRRVRGVGQYWPGGLIRLDRARTMRFTLTTPPASLIQRLTRYAKTTEPGHLVFTRVAPRPRVPMGRICERWVDYYRATGP